MRLLSLAARNLARTAKRSMKLAVLVALCTAVMTVGNALFDGSDAGIERVYAQSFTGDLSLSVDSGSAYGLFGDRTPVVGGFASLPVLQEYRKLDGILASFPGVRSRTAVVSGRVFLESGTYREPCFVFGIDPETYFPLFPEARVVSGRRLEPGEHGVMISGSRAGAIGRAAGTVALAAAGAGEGATEGAASGGSAGGSSPTGGSPSAGGEMKVGDVLRLSVYTGSGFSIEELPIVGILEYPVRNETLDSIVLADAWTMKRLLGMMKMSGVHPEVEGAALTDPAGSVSLESLDDMFEEAIDDESSGTGDSLLAEVESRLDGAGSAGSQPEPDPDAFNFVLVRVSPGMSPASVNARLRSRLDSEGSVLAAIRVEDWRGTSGDSALFIVWIRIIFNTGMGIVFAGAAIILANALSMAVAERTGEIGTMRAMGASRSFVAGLFFLETMLLVISASLAGSLAGALCAMAIRMARIGIGNPVLLTLFGSTVLAPVVTFATLVRINGGIVLASSLVWILPVVHALKIQPLTAMRVE